MKIRKRQILEGSELPNQEKIRTFEEEGNYKYLGNIESGHLQTSGDEGKKNTRVSQTNEKISRNEALQKKISS